MIAEYPAKRCVAIFKWSREWMFRCKSVINSDDHRLQVLRKIGQIIICHFRLTEDETAAVNVENHWTDFAICYGVGSVETKAQSCTIQPIRPDRLTTRMVW